jgi:hypothetical protein
MKALSVRNPWAWLIVRPDIVGEEVRRQAYLDGLIKDVENRTWPTRYRGRVLIHASKGMTKREYEDATDPLWASRGQTIELPAFADLERGGIVGETTIDDCVSSERRTSHWHIEGCFGFHMIDTKPLPFTRCKGALGFFDLPDDVMQALGLK